MIGRRRFMAACAGVPLRVARQQPLAVPMRILTAVCDGHAAQTSAWVQEHVQSANAVLRVHGVSLVHTLGAFEPPRCELLTRSHRNEMGTYAGTTKVVTVLVLPRVRDLDVPTYDLMGVHWRGEGPQGLGRRWVFLTARAKPPVLAHELCHFFGLPHDPVGGTLMTPGPSAPAWDSPHPPKPFAPVLTDGQARQLRRGVRRWLASR